jgi:hypothetical protein
MVSWVHSKILSGLKKTATQYTNSSYTAYSLSLATVLFDHLMLHNTHKLNKFKNIVLISRNMNSHNKETTVNPLYNRPG